MMLSWGFVQLLKIDNFNSMIAKATDSKLKFPYIFLIKVLLVIGLFYIKNNHVELIQSSTLRPQIFEGLFTFLIPSIILSMIRFFVVTIYNARHKQRLIRGNFVIGVSRLTAVLNAVFAIIAIMIAFGINPKDFITSLTIVAMAIAVLFRDYITNMISGLIIMFSEQLNVGDRIKVGEHRGRIVDITFANLVLQDEEDDIIMVPNNLVFTATFMNLSAHQSSLFTVRFELPLQASLHVEELEETLRVSLTTHPNLSNDPEDFQLRIMEVGKDFVRYKIDLHAISNSNRMHKKLENEILREVLKFERQYLKSS
ncbi:mechanosensitive ion channel family protein [Sphingobacterium humi]|uniref:Mechanosensitive ion channel n=1 Tax=Sphingobacterium humi TaxID=1796905 RepID=A0A6N8KU19_9SPHI|nr:mechanosensitive ion channel domain-containing protein [Sphingobacterium humi]MVZ60925.1 mechanosensitive ion channel [Sphingobacterium humi]